MSTERKRLEPENGYDIIRYYCVYQTLGNRYDTHTSERIISYICLYNAHTHAIILLLYLFTYSKYCVWCAEGIINGQPITACANGSDNNHTGRRGVSLEDQSTASARVYDNSYEHIRRPFTKSSSLSGY